MRIGQWRPWTLAAAWAAYWVVLAAVTLAPTVRPIWRATHAGPGKGDINVSVSNALTLGVHLNGATLYTASASLLAIALWIAVPPLVLWAAWVATRERVGGELPVA